MTEAGDLKDYASLEEVPYIAYDILYPMRWYKGKQNIQGDNLRAVLIVNMTCLKEFVGVCVTNKPYYK